MAETLFAAHSGVRYLVLVIAVVALVTAALDLRAAAPGAAAELAGRLFTAALDIQVLLGVLVLLLRPFVPRTIGHVVLMILAVAVAHGTAILARRRPPERRVGLRLTGIAITLLLIVGGILSIRDSVL